MILGILLFFYCGINLFLFLAMTVCNAEYREYTIYPSLIYRLRNEYNLNKIGTGIVVGVITVLCLLAIVASAIVLFVGYMGVCVWKFFCKIFRRKDD